MPTCRSWKTGLQFWKWRPYKVRSLVSNSIYAKKGQKWPSQCQPSRFSRRAQMRPCCLHPSGTPTHLPLLRPLCWSRTYLQRALPEVTSWSWKANDRYIHCGPLKELWLLYTLNTFSFHSNLMHCVHVMPWVWVLSEQDGGLHSIGAPRRVCVLWTPVVLAALGSTLVSKSLCMKSGNLDINTNPFLRIFCYLVVLNF